MVILIPRWLRLSLLLFGCVLDRRLGEPQSQSGSGGRNKKFSSRQKRKGRNSSGLKNSKEY
jgi:hypothetical protein